MNRPSRFIPAVWLAFVVLGIGLYVAGLNAPLFYDSTQFPDMAYLYSQYDSSDVLTMVQSRRSIPKLTFYFNFLTTGADPVYLRLFNVLVLASTSVIVFLLALVLLNVPEWRIPGSDAEKKCVALFVGILYLIHPVQVFVVLYLWQRWALLACFFFFSSLLVYTATRTRRIRSRALGFGSAFSLFLCAVASKENAVALIPTVLVYEAATIKFEAGNTWKRVRLPLCAMALIFVLVWVATTVLGQAWKPDTILKVLGRYYRESGLTLGEVMLTQCRVLFSYLYTIVAPFPSQLLLAKAVTVSRSLTSPPITLAAVAGVLALAAGGVLLLRKRPLIGIGICIFLINVVPEALMVPQFQFFGYRPVIPMVGVFLVLADGILYFLSKESQEGVASRARFMAAGALAVVLALFCAGTIMKSVSWNHPLDLWQQALASGPSLGPDVEMRTYTEILNNLGEALAQEGRYSEAADYFRAVIAVAPQSPTSIYNLANVLEESGQKKEAIPYYRTAIAMRPRYSEAHTNLGRLLREAGMIEQARKHLSEAVKIKPYLSEAHHNYGIALMQSNMPEQAMRHFLKAVEIKPDSPMVHYDLGLALAMGKNIVGAIEHFREAILLKPDFAKAHHNLAIALIESGQRKEGLSHLRKAMEIDPSLDKSRGVLEPDMSSPVPGR